MDLAALPDWSLWGIFAVLLLIVEMLSAAYLALGFAMAAAVVAALVWAAPGMGLIWQALIWAVLGLAMWLALSRWSKARRKKRGDINDFDSRDALPPAERRPRRPDDTDPR